MNCDNCEKFVDNAIDENCDKCNDIITLCEECSNMEIKYCYDCIDTEYCCYCEDELASENKVCENCRMKVYLCENCSIIHCCDCSDGQ